ncbi:hypothetical protein Trydic_g21463 [Trypoxylus dichotomus]
MFRQRFVRDPPSRLTVYRIYKKFVDTGPVTIEAMQARSEGCELDIAVVQQAVLQSSWKSSVRCGLETGIPRKTV